MDVECQVAYFSSRAMRECYCCLPQLPLDLDTGLGHEAKLNECV